MHSHTVLQLFIQHFICSYSILALFIPLPHTTHQLCYVHTTLIWPGLTLYCVYIKHLPTITIVGLFISYLAWAHNKLALCITHPPYFCGFIKSSPSIYQISGLALLSQDFMMYHFAPTLQHHHKVLSPSCTHPYLCHAGFISSMLYCSVSLQQCLIALPIILDLFIPKSAPSALALFVYLRRNTCFIYFAS